MTRYDSLTITPGATMDWRDGDPCSHCGKPVAAEWHHFHGGNNSWRYRAPLYHNVDQRLGFCGATCATEWARADYQRIRDAS